MKKSFTQILTVLGLFLSGANLLFGQSQSSNQAEFSSALQNQATKNSAFPVTQALWGILYDYDLKALTGANGNAGVCVFNNEFWVSRWNTDTICRISATGTFIDKFVIPGVGGAGSGVRAFTTDGTHIYASVNTNSIKKINPATKTLVGTITAPIPNVRSLAHDPTANSGAGGFWISTYGTDITQISMTGATLNAIPSSSHALSGMYGTAVDNYSYGGPYLWVFDQVYSGFYSDIVQIHIPTGAQAGVVHDVMSDIGVNNSLVNTPGQPTQSSLAGGITSRLDGGTLSLIGVIQGSPTNRLFAYDLDYHAAINDNPNAEDFVTVYPNPANNMVNISICKQNNEEASLQIFDSAGKIVFDKKTRGKNNYISVDALAQGIYFIKTNFRNESYSTKFIKE